MNPIIDKIDFDSYLEKGAEGEFFFLSKLDTVDFSDQNTAEIELLPEGKWDHPTAFQGKFIVTRERMEDWIHNFKRKVFGEKLPLDFHHRSDSRTTPGFITNLYRVALDTWEGYHRKFKNPKIKDKILKKIKSGKSCLFATLHITEEDVWQKILNGSLQWISASVGERWKDPSSNKIYDLIKGAALTNYPYIKNMTPISVNFEEHINEWTPDPYSNEHGSQHKEELVNDLEILTDELDLENVEEIESEDGLAFFADHEGNRTYGFKPKGKKEPYGFVPKISLPAEIAKLPTSQQKAFLAAFNKAYRKVKDVEKAKKMALRIAKVKYGFKFEEDINDMEPKSFGQKFEEFLGIVKGLGFHMVKEGSSAAADPSLEEINSLKTQVAGLTMFRDAAIVKENETLLEKYSKITPPAKKIILTMLGRRNEDILLEDNKKTSIRGLILELLTEMEKTPKVNLFETISEPKDEKLEDLDAQVKAYLKDHPDKTYTEALLEVAPKKS